MRNVLSCSCRNLWI